MILCATTIAAIDRRLVTASAWLLAASALSWLGLIHADQIGFGAAPEPALAYLLVAALFFTLSRFSKPAKASRDDASA
jgi:AGZA family xanthine/uracil permease-like MFS transporter